jgi:Response regulator containing CheY-like receiver, AAA-type ATPase, and DNA-binding domains
MSVLLALSHRPSRELLSDRLHRVGVEVRTLDNGTDAQREIQERSFGVVVAEAGLPGRVGLELLRSFPTLQPPFIILGRHGNDEEIVRAFELGAVDYLTLPFSPHIATARILRASRLVSEVSGTDSHS